MLSQTLKKQHIHDLIEWIEAHLTDDLNVDQISLKSGYSKWHMQRMFKEMTGQTLAAYTRKRRLTMAAMALRLTRMTLIDIAVRFGFDNQQNFTRVFKGHFSLTPGAFRRVPYLPVKHFHSRIPLRSPLERATLVERKEELQLCGETLEWECRFGEYIADREQRVAGQARQLVALAGGRATQGWLGFEYGPGHSSADQQNISLLQALEPQHADLLGNPASRWYATPGLYAVIRWSGSPEQLTRVIADIYYQHLPALGVSRRAGKDLLRLDFAQCKPDWLSGVFSIPVMQA
ncbi:helix-turn-helix domain-containing protein [Pantoea sp. C2G6]|uniref:helix-turn-helix domain-containing protein n=1 Tax=Pantoea sp. C2G6 TaxID=3243084 RepID=UPI003EDA8FC0